MDSASQHTDPFLSGGVSKCQQSIFSDNTTSDNMNGVINSRHTMEEATDLLLISSQILNERPVLVPKEALGSHAVTS